jgi:iron(III) transport system substrate-binding protein
MRAIFGAIIARSIAQTGSETAGWNWLRRLDGQTSEYALNPTLLYQKLGRQEGLISLWDMPDIALLQQQSQFPLAYVIPSSGTPTLVDAIAIVNGAKHPQAAREFYEFVTTQQALLAAARKFVRIPVRTDIPADSLPGWIRDARAQIKPMVLDRQMLADSTDAWMKYWDANIRNSERGK